MKIPIKELLNGQRSLQIIGSLKLNSALKFRLARVIKQVVTALAEVEEAKAELIKREGGVLNETQTQFTFADPAAGERVNQEYRELLNEEVEIRFDRFSEATFEKLDITSLDIANCLWLFGDGEVDQPAEVQSNGVEAATAN